MLQLEALNGREAGKREVFRSLPCVIGRAADADFRTEEQGVWDRHVEIRLDEQANFTIHPDPQAKVEINGTLVREGALRNGDVIQVGFSKIQFRLSPTSQQNLRWRETATWVCLAILPLVQLGLVYWLLR